MNSIQKPSIEVPLGSKAHHFARQFAAEQATSHKSKQVYLNTLAVYAVHRYLKWQKIDSNLNQSDSWNLMMRTKWDIADLEIPGMGRLECRPVLPEENVIALPSEVRDDRIGYVAVQFGEYLDKVRLLGFAPIAAQFRIANLQTLDALIDCLNPQTLVNLSQWLQNVLTAGWQTIDALLSPEQIELAFATSERGKNWRREINLHNPESGIIRCKQINLEPSSKGGSSYIAALVVELKPKTDREINIRVQVHPKASEPKYLPPHLRLIVEDWEGTTLEAEARDADNYIQQLFSGQPGEHFRVTVALENTSVTENFAL